MMPIRFAIAVLLCLAAVTGCTGGGDRDPQTVASWAAAARMVAEAWSQGAVPRTYARRALETAERELTTLRERAGDEAAQAVRLAAALRAAVERDDRAAVATELGRP